MKISYIEFPMPDNSKILGLPVAPADNMTSFPTLISLVSPSEDLNSTACTLRGADGPFKEAEGWSHMIRVTVVFMKTLKLG